MKLNDFQKKIIKQGLASKLDLLSLQQEEVIKKAEHDQDFTDRIVTVNQLHFINDQMKAIEGINNQLEIPNFLSRFDKDLNQQLEIFKSNISRLKAEDLPNK